MKKKGFTLVELLAVIVILAIIALIAIPLIGNVIEKSKIGALESSVNGLVESANMYYANETIKGGTISETIFDFEDGEQISTQKLEYKGKVYNGKLILHASGEVAVCIDDTEHYAYKNKDTNEIVSGIGTCLYDGTIGDFSSNSPVEDLKQQIAAATATANKVLEGNTIYTSKGLVTGTMANKAGTTTSATTITESGTNALITIPTNGYYSTSSKISVPIETIQNEVSFDKVINRTQGGGSGDISITVPYENAIIAISIFSDSNSDTLSSSSSGITKIGYVNGDLYSGCVLFKYSGTANTTVTFRFSNSIDNTSWAYVCVEGIANTIVSSKSGSSLSNISGDYVFIFGGRDSAYPSIYYNKSVTVIKAAGISLGATTHHNREMWIEAVKSLSDDPITATIDSYDTYAGGGAVGLN